MENEKRCEWCGKVFKAQKMTTKYCSHRCNGFALEEVNLENYYTIPQIMEKYAMTKGAVLNFVMRHNIPRVKRLREAKYFAIILSEAGPQS